MLAKGPSRGPLVVYGPVHRSCSPYMPTSVGMVYALGVPIDAHETYPSGCLWSLLTHFLGVVAARLTRFLPQPRPWSREGS